MTEKIVAPSEFVPEVSNDNEGEPQLVENLEYLYWQQLDNALLGWIRSSISSEVQIQITQSDTCVQAWNSLCRLFGIQS